MKDDKTLKDFKETGTLHTRSKKITPDNLHPILKKLPLAEKVAAYMFLEEEIANHKRELEEQLALIPKD